MRAVALLLLAWLLAGCDAAPRDVMLHAADRPPALLSEWGVVYAAGGRLHLNDGVIPYDLNAPLFSDYALKLRTTWLPPEAAATYSDTAEFDFPVGTIVSKTFFYQKAPDWRRDNAGAVMRHGEYTMAPGATLDLHEYVLLETRLLVRYAAGWRAFPYVWNSEQSDASLAIAGDVRALQLLADDGASEINYLVPDANQCAGCHTPDHSAGELRLLGPKAWQLSRAYEWWGDDSNQLQHWVAAGLLQRTPAAMPMQPFNAEQRVKAYLDANCAHCHNPSGPADTSALHLGLDAPVDRHYGICKTPVAVGRGSGDRPYDIYPGRPDDSILVYRMEHTDPAIAMPELGRSAVHAEGVAMVRQWILALPGEC